MILPVVALALEVRDDLSGGVDVFFEGFFDFRGHAVRVAKEDVRRKNKMKIDKVGVSDIAVTEIVMADAVLARLDGHHFLDLAVHGGIGGVH